MCSGTPRSPAERWAGNRASAEGIERLRIKPEGKLKGSVHCTVAPTMNALMTEKGRCSARSLCDLGWSRGFAAVYNEEPLAEEVYNGADGNGGLHYFMAWTLCTRLEEPNL